MTQSASSPRLALWVVLLALCGAGLGIVASFEAGEKLLYKEASGQELPYYFLSRALAAPHPGEPAGPLPAPLYPLLLKAAGAGRDGGLPAARRLQLILLGAALPLLSLFAARRVFGRAAGLPAGILTLLLGPLWVHLTWLQPFGWQAALGLMAVGVAAGGAGRAGTSTNAPGATAAPRTGPGRALLVGVLIAAARLFGAAWAPFLALAWIVAHLSRRRYLPALAVAVGASLMLAAPLLNRVTSVPVATPSLLLGGMESAQGFHDGASGIDPRRGERGEWRWFSQRELATQLDGETGKRTPLPLASRIWYGKTLRWCLGHPLKTVGLVVLKAWYVLGGYDPPSPESLGFRASQTIPWARLLLPVAALIGGLGLAGLWATRRGGPTRPATARAADPVPAGGDTRPVDTLPILTLLAATLLAGGLYFVRSGDRLALLLALTGPAAWALGAIFTAPRRISLALVAGGVTILLALPWFTLAPRAESAADDRYLVGSVMDRLGRTSDAMSELETALRIDPSHALARLGLAMMLARDGLYDQTVEEAERVTREQPRMSTAFRLLAVACQNKGLYERSAAAYQRLTELEPVNPEAWNNLGTLYVSLGRYDDAVAALKKALALDPGYRSARTNLAEVEKRGPEGIKGGVPSARGPGRQGGGSLSDLSRGIVAAMNSLRAGNVAEAEKTVADLRATYGASPDLDFVSGTVALQKGEVPQAIEFYERCRTSMKDNTMLLNNLAAAYARAGRVAEAVPLWERVLALKPDDELARKNLDAARSQTGGAK